jgi:hypothetical protein
VPAWLPLGEVQERARRTGVRALAVLDDAGAMIGMLDPAGGQAPSPARPPTPTRRC